MKKLNLGSGKNELAGFENLDIENGWTFESGPWPDYGTVDAITVSHALMYVSEPRLTTVLYEMFKCLKFNGILRITEDNTEDDQSERRDGYPGHVVKTGPKMMRKYLESVGFEVHDVTPTETLYDDDSLIQSFHGDPPKVFYMEARKVMRFRESALAHHYLDDLVGIEIGASAHNPFNLPHCQNVDYTDSIDTKFKQAELRNCGKMAKVDVVANGDKLPFSDESLDYIVAAHVLEHFFDPIRTMEEWWRVVRPGGYILLLLPHEKRVPDESRPFTTLTELLARHEGRFTIDQVNWTGAHGGKNDHGHWTVWNLESFLQLADYYDWTVVETQDPDEKIGNGFMVLLKK